MSIGLTWIIIELAHADLDLPGAAFFERFIGRLRTCHAYVSHTLQNTAATAAQCKPHSKWNALHAVIEGRKEVRRLRVTNGGSRPRPVPNKQYMFSHPGSNAMMGPPKLPKQRVLQSDSRALFATSEDMLQTTLVTALGIADDGIGWWSMLT